MSLRKFTPGKPGLRQDHSEVIFKPSQRMRFGIVTEVQQSWSPL